MEIPDPLDANLVALRQIVDACAVSVEEKRKRVAEAEFSTSSKNALDEKALVSTKTIFDEDRTQPLVRSETPPIQPPAIRPSWFARLFRA